MTGRGRPTKRPQDLKRNRVVVHMTDHQVRVLDTLVDFETNQNKLTPTNRQDLILRLLRAHYAEQIRQGMPPVPRED